MSEPVVRWKLVATGTVQLVGYRQRVKREADLRGLSGRVLNDETNEDRVLIEVQGPADTLEEFRQAIAKPEGRSVPTAVTQEGDELPAEEKLADFRVKRGEVHLETLERMEYAGVALDVLTQETKNLSSETRRGFESLGAKVEKVGASVEKGNRATLLLHRDTIHRFDEMSVAYGMIGKRLGLIEKDLRAQTKATVQQTAALLRLAKSMEKVARSSSGTRPSRRK